MGDALSMWTVYGHPSDMPDVYVARRFECTAGAVTATDAVVMGTLAEIRATMSAYGLTRLERDVSDDPVIVEVWV